MSASEIAAALSTARLQSKWRMEFHHLRNDITLINDAYNANPDSMAAALKTLVTISSEGRKWAVLGAMHELGDLTIEEHDRIGRLAVRLDVDQLVVVGQAAKPLHLGAQTEGSWDQESVWFPDFEQAADYICQKVAPHDVVLFKASRSEGFEQLAQLVETRLRKDECS
jgi:UDP-N-acetylmuramoyl-tripeptide--D-alanyl-D-alanine ligase